MTTCFRLKLQILTPFYLADGLTLDGLLAGAIYKQMGLLGEDAIAHIPLEMEHGIFKASSIAYEKKYQLISIGRVMNLRGHDLSDSLFSPNRKSGKYGHVDRKRGPYKTNLTSYPGVQSKEVYFWGVGDMEKVKFLLSNYILGIGKRCNAGAGEITDIEIVEINEDLSWITKSGKPARPIPVSIWNTLNGDKSWPTVPATVTVPYWGGNYQDAVVPSVMTV